MVHSHATAAPSECGDSILLSTTVECLLHTVSPNTLTRLYRFSNDTPVRSTGCPTLIQSRWAPSCHTWRRTNLTWQTWADISILLIKMERVRKHFQGDTLLKKKAQGLFHSCFAHWPESIGNGVIGSAEVCSTEGHFTPFVVMKKYTSGTSHAQLYLFVSHTKANTMQTWEKTKTERNQHVQLVTVVFQNQSFCVDL